MFCNGTDVLPVGQVHPICCSKIFKMMNNRISGRSSKKIHQSVKLKDSKIIKLKNCPSKLELNKASISFAFHP